MRRSGELDLARLAVQHRIADRLVLRTRELPDCRDFDVWRDGSAVMIAGKGRCTCEVTALIHGYLWTTPLPGQREERVEVILRVYATALQRFVTTYYGRAWPDPKAVAHAEANRASGNAWWGTEDTKIIALGPVDLTGTRRLARLYRAIARLCQQPAPTS